MPTAGGVFGSQTFKVGWCNRWLAYGQSKVANLLFAYELERRLSAGTHRSLAAHPGWAFTGLVETSA